MDDLATSGHKHPGERSRDGRTRVAVERMSISMSMVSNLIIFLGIGNLQVHFYKDISRLDPVFFGNIHNNLIVCNI